MGRKSGRIVEIKTQVVEQYLSGKASFRQLASENGIGYTTVRRWLANYNSMGVDGLAEKSENARYSIETKRAAVLDYLAGKGSLLEIQKKYRIRSDHQLRNWIKVYNSHGEFKQPSSGGASRMAKGRNTTQDERIEIVSHCIANNRDYGKTIEQYDVSYNQLYGWVRKYESEGADGLVDRRGKRKAESPMTEIEKLQAQLKLQKAENLRLQMENDLLKKLEEIERRRGRN